MWAFTCLHSITLIKARVFTLKCEQWVTHSQLCLLGSGFFNYICAYWYSVQSHFSIWASDQLKWVQTDLKHTLSIETELKCPAEWGHESASDLLTKLLSRENVLPSNLIRWVGDNSLFLLVPKSAQDLSSCGEQRLSAVSWYKQFCFLKLILSLSLSLY